MDGVSVRYRDGASSGRVVFRAVDFSVRRGDFVAITGPNGGGKTTLLRLLLGLLHPTSGVVRYPCGVPRVGYLPQKTSVDGRFPISVGEVVASGLRQPLLRPLSKTVRAQRVGEALREVELADLASRPIGDLSGGQLQRVLLARAIVDHPELLVLDEPLSYVDKRFEQHLYDLLGRLQQQSTIVLVSHEMSAIGAMATRHVIVANEAVRDCEGHRHFVPADCH